MSLLSMPDRLPPLDGVVLRPFRDSDVEMVRDLAADPYVPLVGSLPAQANEVQALEFIQRQRERVEQGVGYSFCVADLLTDRALGTAGLWLVDLAHGRATAGYTVAPSARGRRVATKALTVLTSFGWTLPGLFRIELYVEPWNIASLRTAEGAGYAREGLLRSHQRIGERRVDMILYAVVRPD